jgi:hypothetical protein
LVDIPVTESLFLVAAIMAMLVQPQKEATFLFFVALVELSPERHLLCYK